MDKKIKEQELFLGFRLVELKAAGSRKTRDAILAIVKMPRKHLSGDVR